MYAHIHKKAARIGCIDVAEGDVLEIQQANGDQLTVARMTPDGDTVEQDTVSERQLALIATFRSTPY